MLEEIANRISLALLGLPRPIVALLAGSEVTSEGQTLDLRVQFLLRMLALQGGPDICEMEPAEARDFYRKVGPLLSGERHEMARVRDLTVPGPSRDVPVRIYTPGSASSKAPVVVYFHGGGWVIGDLETHDVPCRLLAERADCHVVAIDYRLAPEHPFPAAVDDAFAAYRWVVENAGTFGGDPGRVAVAGDSAGGNLAVVTSLLARDDEAVPLPVAQFLIYPVTDAAEEHPSTAAYAEGFFLTRATMRWFFDLYVPSVEDRKDPRVSPLRAASLEGLPPTHLSTAGFDPLRDEGKALADRLRDAGVPVQFRNHPSLIHGWFSMAGAIEAAGQAFEDLVHAVRDGLAGQLDA